MVGAMNRISQPSNSEVKVCPTRSAVRDFNSAVGLLRHLTGIHDPLDSSDFLAVFSIKRMGTSGVYIIVE